MFQYFTDIFERKIPVYNDGIFKVIMILFGVCFLPVLICLKYIFKKLLGNFLKMIFSIICQIYVVFVDIYNKI